MHGTLIHVVCLLFSSLICLHLPSDSTSRWTPLMFSYIFPAVGQIRDFHPLECVHAGHTILRLLQSRGGVASMAGACTLIICAGSIALGPLRWGYWEYRTGFCCVLASRRVCPVSRVCRVRCVRRVRPVRPVRPVRRVRRVCPVPGSLALTSFRRPCRLLKSPYLPPGSER